MNGYCVVHDSPGRMRFRRISGACKPSEALVKALDTVVKKVPGASVSYGRRSGSILITYVDSADRANILKNVGELKNAPRKKSYNPFSLPAVQEDRDVPNPIPGKLISYLFPPVVRFTLSTIKSIPYIFHGLGALFKGKLSLDTLDAAALVVCLAQRDFSSLGSIVFFFALGEWIADWTRKKSRASLADSLALNIDKVWIKEGDVERQIPLEDVKQGDLVVVRAGSVFPVDGVVDDGEGLVNQAAMTGEPLPVHKKKGMSVFAGTAIAEGTFVIKATKVGDNTRITSILSSIEDSEKYRAAIQSKYEHMADAIVPYNFLLSGGVLAVTRNLQRASSVLLVDYSCAIRLSTPLSIITGMRETADNGVLVKGGKYMEALAEADVIVFDKTGTLTEAKPNLAGIVTFGDWDEDTILKLSACLEEHFAHPVGLAVVEAAEKRNLKHKEEHTEVDYIVAHGISSHWNGQVVAIGSYHFVHEDCKVKLSKKQESIIEEKSLEGYSLLYLAIGGKLAAILLIEDSMRPDAADVMQRLRESGIKRIIMLTGDGATTAKVVAEKAGIDEYKAHLLPQDKAEFIKELKAQGSKVIMVGDGINDSVALSIADVGIAMAGGADIAREVADIVLVDGNLEGILFARRVSRLVLSRIHSHFYISIIANSFFLAGGLIGLITPAVSALLHNSSTALLALSSIRPLTDKRHRLNIDKEKIKELKA